MIITTKPVFFIYKKSIINARLSVLQYFNLFCLKDLEKDGIPIPQVLVENAPSQHHTMESLSFKSAVYYHRLDNKEKMMAALERLPKLEERTDFLISRNYIEEAASLLEKNGVYEDSSFLL